MFDLKQCLQDIEMQLWTLERLLAQMRGQEWQVQVQVPERERQERERERERQEEQEQDRQEREAKRLRRCLRKQLTLLKDVITKDILITKNLHSLLLAMLLFALFLELLGWLVLIGLFTTVLIYLLLIIHPTFVSVKNLKAGADVAISRHTFPESPFSVWNRKKLGSSSCKSPNFWQWQSSRASQLIACMNNSHSADGFKSLDTFTQLFRGKLYFCDR